MGFEIWIQGSGLRAQGSGLRVQGSGLRAQGSGLRVFKMSRSIRGRMFNVLWGSEYTRIWGLR